jgi:parallel beta-helix repeat protein
MQRYAPRLTALIRTMLVGAGLICLPVLLAQAAVLTDDATGGDCTAIGSWQAANKTCKLNTDVGESVVIASDDLTLHCDGHTIIGSGTGNGIELQTRLGVTIKNCTVTGFRQGVRLAASSHNTIKDSTISTNTQFGIVLVATSNENTIKANTVNNNPGGMILQASSSTVSHVLTCSKSLSIGVLREFYVDKRFTEGA